MSLKKQGKLLRISKEATHKILNNMVEGIVSPLNVWMFVRIDVLFILMQ